MTQTPFDLNTLFDSYRDALAPVFRAQQEGLKSVERLARYQFAVAGDFLEWSLSQAKASVGPKSPADLLSEQTALNTQFSEKLRARGDELKQIATETHGVVSKWLDETRSAKGATLVAPFFSTVAWCVR
jgi:hypothetical protein